MPVYLTKEERAKCSKTLSQLDEIGPDVSNRLWCDLYAQRRRLRWSKEHGLKPYAGGVERLLGRRRRLRAPTGDDHGQLWGRARRPLIYTMQPYYYFDVVELGKWASELGLSVRCSAEFSWHFPGQTALIEIATPESLRLLTEYANRG